MVLLQSRQHGCVRQSSQSAVAVRHAPLKSVAPQLQEYQDSHDVEEARRRLRELALPFFHHETVKQALLAAMQVWR